MIENAVDPKVLADLRELDSGEDLLFTLIMHFFEETPGRLESLRAALKGRDAEAVVRTAHYLKGSSGNLGAQRMYRLCAELQTVGKDGNLTAVEPLLVQLDAEFEQVQSTLTAVQGSIARDRQRSVV